MDAISASVQPASARRVTAVPRKSWKVISTMPAARDARCQDVRRPSLVHGRPALDVKMMGEERGMRHGVEDGFQILGDRNLDPLPAF